MYLYIILVDTYISADSTSVFRASTEINVVCALLLAHSPLCGIFLENVI